MAIVSVKIPQLGEGLQEARLVELLKKPGDTVKKDEPIYEIETDKAITEIESPYDGTIVSWTAELDAVLPIGADIGSMEVADGTPEMSGGHDSAPKTSQSNPSPVQAAAVEVPHSSVEASSAVKKPVAAEPVASAQPAFVGSKEDSSVHTAVDGIPIPPRTRRILKEKGIAHLASQIPARGKRLMPEDVDSFLDSQHSTAPVPLSISPSTGVTASNADYEECPLNATQRTLNFRMARGAQMVLAATLETDIDWTAIMEARQLARETGGPTGFAMLSWCVARAMAEYPVFRSTLSADGETLRTYRHVNLGIAVSVENDLLHTAVIRRADTLNRPAFFDEMAARIQEARDGKDQVDATTTVSVSNIGTAGMRVGIPVVVTPAVATIAIGAIRDVPIPLDSGFQFRKMVSLTMSFDHRLVNGIGAANFLNAIRDKATQFTLEDKP